MLQEAERGAFTVLVDGFVTAESGTGIVHCAPAFGEDDYRVCMAAGILQKGEGIVCPVDANGRFTDEVTDFAKVYVKVQFRNCWFQCHLMLCVVGRRQRYYKDDQKYRQACRAALHSPFIPILLEI